MRVYQVLYQGIHFNQKEDCTKMVILRMTLTPCVGQLQVQSSAQEIILECTGRQAMWITSSESLCRA